MKKDRNNISFRHCEPAFFAGAAISIIGDRHSPIDRRLAMTYAVRFLIYAAGRRDRELAMTTVCVISAFALFGYYSLMLQIANWSLTEFLDAVSLIFEIGGVLVLIVSGFMALVQWLRKAVPLVWSDTKNSVQKLRAEFSHQIVFALEFFIAADVIKSIQTPTFAELTKLAIIVAIRTVLHYSLSS